MSFTFEGRRFRADARKLVCRLGRIHRRGSDGPCAANPDDGPKFGRREVSPLIDRFRTYTPRTNRAALSYVVFDLFEQTLTWHSAMAPCASASSRLD